MMTQGKRKWGKGGLPGRPGPSKHWQRQLVSGMRYGTAAALLLVVIFPSLLFDGPPPEGERLASDHGARRGSHKQGDQLREDSIGHIGRRDGTGDDTALMTSRIQQLPLSLRSGSVSSRNAQHRGAAPHLFEEDLGDDSEDDGIAAGRHQKRAGSHHHSKAFSAGGRSPSQGQRKHGSGQSNGNARRDAELDALHVMGHKSYKVIRQWEIEGEDREEVMWEQNLANNLMAADTNKDREEYKRVAALEDKMQGAFIADMNGRMSGDKEALPHGHEPSPDTAGGEEAVADGAAEEDLSQIGAGLQRYHPAKTQPGSPDIVSDSFKDAKFVTRSSRKRSSPTSLIPLGKEKDLGWRCSHLKDCDEWKRERDKYLKASSDAGKKRTPSPHVVAEQNAALRLWGAAAARALASGKEASCPQMTEEKQAMSQLLHTVRVCCRFLLAQHHFLNLREDVLRSEVASLMGIVLTDSVVKAVREELRHVTHGSVEIVTQGFERAQAGEDINPKPKSKPGMLLQKLSRKEKQRLAEQEDAVYLAQQIAKEEANRRAVEHTWGASKLDKSVDEQLWASLAEVSGLRYRLAGLLATRAKTTLLGELRLEDWEGATPIHDEVHPMLLNLGLFLEPGQDAPLVPLTDVSPVLSIERKGSVGTALHEYRFKPAMLELMPQKDRLWHYSNCAVVGNSGMLLKGARHGTAIDAAEAVFRINLAPTRPYEKYVGTQTTFDVVNTRHAELLLQGKHRSARLMNSTLVAFEVTAPYARDTVYPDLLRRFTGMDLQHAHAIVLSPHLVSGMLQVWGQMKNSFEAVMYESNMTVLKPYSKPDTGFFAVMFALQVCEHVHLYGMSNWRPGSDLRYHYFTESEDLQKGAGKARPFTFTREILRAIALWPGSDARGKLTLHKS